MSADALVMSGDALREQHGRLREGAHGHWQQSSSTQPGPRSLIKTRRWPRSRLEEKKGSATSENAILGAARGFGGTSSGCARTLALVAT
jgi:hypothetical protein